MTTKTPIIELKNVKKVYKIGKISLEVLKDISLAINQGEFVVIFGPSGSGKTTLMNQVGILDTPTQGQVFLAGKNIYNFSEEALGKARGKKIGFVFQQFNLIPTLTALENVTLPAIFQGMSESARNERGKKLLEKVGLADRINHKPQELSGGQQQRVAIARALINNPPIILADEPTGNLDSVSGKQVINLLSELHEKQKKTIIIITHDTHLIPFNHRTVGLKDGKIVKDSKKHRVQK